MEESSGKKSKQTKIKLRNQKDHQRQDLVEPNMANSEHSQGQRVVIPERAQKLNPDDSEISELSPPWALNMELENKHLAGLDNKVVHLSPNQVKAMPNLTQEAQHELSPEPKLDTPITHFAPIIRKKWKRQARQLGHASSTRLSGVKLAQKKGGNEFQMD